MPLPLPRCFPCTPRTPPASAAVLVHLEAGVPVVGRHWAVCGHLSRHVSAPTTEKPAFVNLPPLDCLKMHLLPHLHSRYYFHYCRLAAPLPARVTSPPVPQLRPPPLILSVRRRAGTGRSVSDGRGPSYELPAIPAPCSCRGAPPANVGILRATPLYHNLRGRALRTCAITIVLYRSSPLQGFFPGLT